MSIVITVYKLNDGWYASYNGIEKPMEEITDREGDENIEYTTSWEIDNIITDVFFYPNDIQKSWCDQCDNVFFDKVVPLDYEVVLRERYMFQ